MTIVLSDGSTITTPADCTITAEGAHLYFGDVLVALEDFVALFDGDGDCVMTLESLLDLAG